MSERSKKYRRKQKIPRSTEYRERRLREAVEKESGDTSDSSTEFNQELMLKAADFDKTSHYLSMEHPSNMVERMVLDESSDESSTEFEEDTIKNIVGLKTSQCHVEEHSLAKELNATELEINKIHTEEDREEIEAKQKNINYLVEWSDTRMATVKETVQDDYSTDDEVEGTHNDSTTYQTDEESSDTDDKDQCKKENEDFEHLHTFLNGLNCSKAFEAVNAKLLNVVHAAKGVHKQICRHINLNSSYAILKKKVEPFASLKTITFCSDLKKSIVQNTEKISTVRYFGKSSSVHISVRESLQLSDLSYSYQKITKDGCLYLSSLKENKRSDNSFAKLKDGTYVRIIYFIVDRQKNKEYTVCNKVVTTNAFENECPMTRKIISINSNNIAVNTNEISRICVRVQVQKKVT